MISPLSLTQAASAYSNATNIVDKAAQPNVVDEFSKMITDSISGAADSLQKAEDMSTQAVLGNKTDLTSLVTAISNAELTLNTIVSIRDKAISAYQDIIKMPI
jgi:flagellar hook-basal body complex protein FliE